MNLANPARSMLQKVPGLNGALDKILARLNALWAVEHHPDGTHGAVTADSLTVDEATIETVTVTTLTATTATVSGTLAVGGAAEFDAAVNVDAALSADSLSVGTGVNPVTLTCTDADGAILATADTFGLDIKATGSGTTVGVYAADTLSATFHGSASNAGSKIVVPTADLIGSAPGPSVQVGRNSDATTPAAGTLLLTARDGTAYYLWVDATGDLRIHTSAPGSTASDTAGTVVGTQS